MASLSVLFAYGAGARVGGPQQQAIQSHLQPATLDVLGWGELDPAIDPPPGFEGYMRDRFGLMAPAPAVNELPVTFDPGAFVWDLVPADWRRNALRLLYGSVADSWATVADAVYYLHNGGHVRDLVTPRIADWGTRHEGTTRVAIGVSLGGLILVDALSGMGALAKHAVDLLVTVGSQAGIIFLADGLTTLRRSGPSPDPFTPWLNLWNPDDFMSWPTHGAIERPGIVDRTVHAPDLSFPETHNAYFDLDETYKHIRTALATLP